MPTGHHLGHVALQDLLLHAVHAFHEGCEGLLEYHHLTVLGLSLRLGHLLPPLVLGDHLCQELFLLLQWHTLHGLVEAHFLLVRHLLRDLIELRLKLISVLVRLFLDLLLGLLLVPFLLLGVH